ncbi:ABC transporter permease, partial [Acidobacteriota bacterium]
MTKTFKFAAHNVARNKRRTLITLATIIVGLCAINVGRGIFSGMQKESQLSLTEGRTGEIQIHKKGYFEASNLDSLKYSIADFSSLREKIKGMDGIQELAGRIQFGGLLAKGDETAVVVFCRAVDPAKELKVCPRIRENIIEGAFLSEEIAQGAVIASGLQKGVKAKIGDDVIIVSNTKDGYQNAIEVEIVGIIEEKAAQANQRLVYLSIEKAQELLYMQDEVTEIVIKTSGNVDLGKQREMLDRQLGDKDLESNTWEIVAPFFVDIMKKQDMVLFALCIIFFFIVITSITNTMILTIFERKREIGTMMAIGIKTKQVTRLIIAESFIIGVIGSILGILISLAIIMILNNTGLNYKPPTGTTLVTIYPLINPKFMLLSLVLGVLSAVFASIYPARKVLQMDPIEAL